jgi:hypothetical protein
VSRLPEASGATVGSGSAAFYPHEQARSTGEYDYAAPHQPPRAAAGVRS